MVDRRSITSEQDLLTTACVWQDQGHRIVLARVLNTWGSAPRPVGSMMVIRDDGHFVGSVSGGCVEGEVIHAAEEIFTSGQAKHLSYGISNSQAWKVGLACGGNITIYAEPLNTKKSNLLKHTMQLIAERKSCALVTHLITGDTASYEPSQNTPLEFSPNLFEEIDKALRHDKSTHCSMDGAEYFIHILSPAIRLFVIGAVHITQALADMAAILSHEVIVIDPRTAFANAERFPHLRLDHRWPDEALRNYNVDSRSAIVTLTHDPKLDDAALQIALRSDAFYIGSLGSQKTHAARLARLQDAGFSKDIYNRIHGPIGLDIGSQSPAEIATSIVAEITHVLRRTND